MPNFADRLAEQRAAERLRDVELFGAQREAVMLLRRRGYAVVTDGRQFLIDGRRANARELKLIADRQLRLMGVRPRTRGKTRRLRPAASGRTMLERLEYFSVPEPNSGCRLWLGATDAAGYGKIRHYGPMAAAHRVSWQIAFGPIPNGLIICHKCDVPACINPAHLFLGTHADNAADRDIKGRRIAPRGERNPLSKLTAAEVRSIRLDARRQADIAFDFGIGQAHVSAIKRGAVWSGMLDVGSHQRPKRGNNCLDLRGEKHPQAKITLDEARRIRADRRRQVDIAAEYGIQQCHVSRIKRGVVWPEARDVTAFLGISAVSRAASESA